MCESQGVCCGRGGARPASEVAGHPASRWPRQSRAHRYYVLPHTEMFSGEVFSAGAGVGGRKWLFPWSVYQTTHLGNLANEVFFPLGNVCQNYSYLSQFLLEESQDAFVINGAEVPQKDCLKRLRKYSSAAASLQPHTSTILLKREHIFLKYKFSSFYSCPPAFCTENNVYLTKGDLG